MPKPPDWKLQFEQNRRLEFEEIENQLKQNTRLNIQHHYWGSLIKLNSSYIESHDILYEQHGWLSMFAGIPAAAFFFAAIFSVFIVFFTGRSSGRVLEGCVPVFIAMASTILFAAIAKSELFRLTHMPMRLDRRANA